MIKKKLKSKPNNAVKKINIMDRVKKVQELPLVVTAAFYGRSGTGKTTIASTFPKPILFLDIGEKGTDSIHDQDNIDVLQCDSWSDIEEIFWPLKDGTAKYKTVVIDAAHSMQDLALLEAKRQANKDENEQVSKRDFGVAAGMMKQWITNYRDLESLGINVIFLVHDRVSKEEGDNEDGMLSPEVGPRLMPSVASPLTGAVKVVGHTFIREQITKVKEAGKKPERTTQYCMRVGPHSYYITKVRSPKSQIVPAFITDPTYDKIVKIMRGQIANPEPKTPALRRIK